MTPFALITNQKSTYVNHCNESRNALTISMIVFYPLICDEPNTHNFPFRYNYQITHSLALLTHQTQQTTPN